MSLIETIVTVLSCVALLLFSIHKFSNHIQKIAGDRLKNIMQVLTSNPLRGTLVGTFVTGIMNSSTATTVLVVGLVNAGFLSFTNSLGVIFGANIGSTVTSQLIALKLTSLGPYIVITGFVMTFFENRFQKYSKPIFYFGLILLSLHLVSTFIAPFANDPAVIIAFSKISNLGIAILAGAFFTAFVVQSSGVTTGLAIILVAQNLLSFEQALGIVLGANIGTTLTTLLTSIRMNYEAKRAAMAHVLFNIIGVLAIIPFLGFYSAFIKIMGGSPAQQIANAHIIFNIISAVIFLIFLKPFANLINLIIKPSRSPQELDI
jgi:phosphate:Na+ symporter